jgi:hypothetical protein
VPDGDDLCVPVTGAFGVDLKASSGDRLRVVRTPELVDEIVFSAQDGSHSPPFQSCATVHFDDSGKNGDATVDCAAGAWVLKGTVSFQGC